MSRKSVIECRIDSRCLGAVNASQIESLLGTQQKHKDVFIHLTPHNKSSNISGEMVVSEGAERNVSQAIFESRFMDDKSATALHEIFEQVKEILKKSELLGICILEDRWITIILEPKLLFKA